MEIQNNVTQGMSPLAPAQAPATPPAQSDARPTADAAATIKDPTPEVPLPMPANATQSGLVSKATLPEKEAAPKMDSFGISAAERSLKPYGINMLPEKQDADPQKAPPQDDAV